MRIYENFLRPFLFAMDPETAHMLAVSVLERAGRSPMMRNAISRRLVFSHPSLESEVAGIRFVNPVGLAAGFDKDCRLAQALPLLGFGFIELGTVTPRAQPGNPRPRIFRIPESHALINRMGLNNHGADSAASRLKALAYHAVPIGISIGKGAATPSEDAVEDYRKAFSILAPWADYVALNVSSPNTKGLRDLQERDRLASILAMLREINGANKPVFVKLAPDMPIEQLDLLCPLLLESAGGIIVTNTTVSRDGIPQSYAEIQGGLSGQPLRSRSTRMIADVYQRTGGKLPIIGVGGIFSAQDAFDKILAGASLIQIYTGLIYRGPGLVREILMGLAQLLSENGFHSISGAVGAGQRNMAFGKKHD